MPLTEHTGDLFTSDAEALGHGVNCKGLMGKGIARQFRELWPEMYEEYRLLCVEGLLRPGQIFPWRSKVETVVINIASQEYPGPDARWEWLLEGTKRALEYMDQRGLKVLAIPRIGCGIGGLEWATVRETLEAANEEYRDIEIQVYTLPV